MVVLGAASAVSPQTGEPGPIRSSPAYAEVLLRKTELQADLEAFLATYTESHPRIVDTRYELASIERSMEKLFAVRPTETAKLTLALGKLIVKRAAVDTEHARLLRTYNAEHPEVKRAKRRLDIFDTSIAEILK